MDEGKGREVGKQVRSVRSFYSYTALHADRLGESPNTELRNNPLLMIFLMHTSQSVVVGTDLSAKHSLTP